MFSRNFLVVNSKGSCYGLWGNLQNLWSGMAHSWSNKQWLGFHTFHSNMLGLKLNFNHMYLCFGADLYFMIAKARLSRNGSIFDGTIWHKNAEALDAVTPIMMCRVFMGLHNIPEYPRHKLLHFLLSSANPRFICAVYLSTALHRLQSPLLWKQTISFLFWSCGSVNACAVIVWWAGSYQTVLIIGPRTWPVTMLWIMWHSGRIYIER